MFDCIKRLFGEGKLRFEVECDDGTIGSVKIGYIGDLVLLNMNEAEAQVIQRCLVENGKRVTKITFIGAY